MLLSGITMVQPLTWLHSLTEQHFIPGCIPSPLDTELVYWMPSPACTVPLKWRGTYKGLDLIKK